MTISEHDDKTIFLRVDNVADILVADLGDRKIVAVKILRDMTGLGLRESKDAIDAAYARSSATRLRLEIVKAAEQDDNELLIQLAANLRSIISKEA